jgi:hypothetical protein
MKKCLVCGKHIETGEFGEISGGTLTLEFHYGSIYDQCGYASLPIDKTTTLLQSDQIRGYLCDTCFPQVNDRLEGYNIQRKIIETKTTKD